MARSDRSLQVCVITSRGFVAGRGHREVARAAIEGGADSVQLRAPELDDEDLLGLARNISHLCRDAGVLFVVNDRLEVAITSGAGGVHLGQNDDPLGARDRLGEEPVLGISVGSHEEAQRAAFAGADYLGVTVWSTRTKPDATPLGLAGIHEIASATTLPVVGVGGIDEGNAAEVLHAGAFGVAVVSAIGAAPDPVEATRRLCAAVRGGGAEEG